MPEDYRNAIRLLLQQGDPTEAARLKAIGMPSPTAGPASWESQAASPRPYGGEPDNIRGPKPGNPGYEEKNSVDEQGNVNPSPGLIDKIRKKFSGIASRDISEAKKDESKAVTAEKVASNAAAAEGQPQPQAQQMQQDGGQAPQEDRQNWWDNPQQPVSPGARSGPSGNRFDVERAKLAAGDTGSLSSMPSMKQAYESTRDSLTGGAKEYDRIKRDEEMALTAQLQARREVQQAEEAKAQEHREFLQSRMDDEEDLRTRLAQSATINPDRYREEHPGRIAAGMFGMLLTGLGGGDSSAIANRLQKRISQDIDAQAKTFENNLGMSKEVRAQWDARMATLGDIHNAKISAKMQGVEAAKDYLVGKAQITKTQDAKMRVQEMVSNLDMKMADMRNELASNVSKQGYHLLEKKDAEARSVGNRAHSEQREDRHRAEDAQLKQDMLGQTLATKVATSGGVAGGSGGKSDRFDQTQAQKINAAEGKIAQFSESVQHTGKLLDSGVKLGAGRSALSNYGFNATAELGASEGEKELIRSVRDEARQIIMATGGKNLTANELKIAKAAMEGGGISFEDMKHIHSLAVRESSVLDKAARALGNERAQELSRAWRGKAESE